MAEKLCELKKKGVSGSGGGTFDIGTFDIYGGTAGQDYWVEVNLGYKPDSVALFFEHLNSSNYCVNMFYNKDFSTTQYEATSYGNTGTSSDVYNLGAAMNIGFWKFDITNNGFKVSSQNSTNHNPGYYIAGKL